jgi:rod shape-determining protein MreC
VLDAIGAKSLDNSKMFIRNSFAHVFSYTSVFGRTLDDFFTNFKTISALNEKIDFLEKENGNMEIWKNKALIVDAENKSLKELLKFNNLTKYNFESVRIAIDNSKSFNRQVMIETPDLQKNQTVVSAYGLVGRVLNANEKYASILLITDINSKVPAIIERTRDKVIVAGKNQNKLILEYLPDNAKITVGDRVITSGNGSVFEPGILIGSISYIDADVVKMTPATDFNKLEFVSVIKEALVEE